jgi:Rad3-related DNA helicase
MSELPPPEAFGLPEKFTGWRKNQDDAITKSMDSEKRVVIPVCPTGFGKSLAYVTMAVLYGGRAVLLTSTKGLQTQLLNDFECIGAVDIRGKNAYRCVREIDKYVTCDYGVCNFRVHCQYKDGGCHYYDQVRRVNKAPIVISNYACWMSVNKYAEGFGHFNFMVCDEAHDTPNILSSFLTVTLDRTEPLMLGILPNRDSVPSMTIKDWKEWAKAKLPDAEASLEILKGQVHAGDANYEDRRTLGKLKRIVDDLKVLAVMTDKWVMSLKDYTIDFAPIWPAPYCENNLFLDIDHILLTSASVRKKTADMLGLGEDDYDMMEYPHTFPVERRQLVHIPTVRMNYRTTDEQLRTWVNRIDQIIKPRLDRKGIVHTVSYKRRDMVLKDSKYAAYMLTHKRRDTESKVRKFKESGAPCVLVSPSMTTGWDFPDSDCRYNIIGKIAYPDTTDTITKARCKDDKEYAPYIAAQELVQAVGRSVRSETDWAENFILDDNALWFMKNYKDFMPKYFTDAYRVGTRTLPQPYKEK